MCGRRAIIYGSMCGLMALGHDHCGKGRCSRQFLNTINIVSTLKGFGASQLMPNQSRELEGCGHSASTGTLYEANSYIAVGLQEDISLLIVDFDETDINMRLLRLKRKDILGCCRMLRYLISYLFRG